MAGQFDFMSPGAAFSDQLTQSLVERKAQERQNLINTLGVKAELRAEDEAAQMKQVRDQQMAEGKQRGEIERVGALTAHLKRGDNLNTLGYSPDDVGLLKKYGAVNSQPQMTAPPIMGADTGAAPTAAVPAQMQAQDTYAGSPQEREEDEIKKSTLGFINAIQDPELKQQAQSLAAMNRGMIPPQAQNDFINHNVMEFDPETKVFKKIGSAYGGTIIENKGFRPPAPYHEHIIPIGIDPATGNVRLYDTDKRQEINTTSAPKPTGAGGTSGVVKLNPTAISKHGDMVNAFDQNGDAKHAGYVRQSALDLLATADPKTVNPKVIATVRGLIMNPQFNPDISSWTDKDKAELDDLRGKVWPSQLDDAYRKATAVDTTHGFQWLRGVLGMPPVSGVPR